MRNIEIIGSACVGCRSCEQICPQKCIQIYANKEGFLYPHVNTAMCVNCSLCLSHCPVSLFEKENKKPLETIGLKNKDKERVKQSASGGASDLLANNILEKGGIVYGAAYTEDLEVRHFEVTDVDQLYRLQSSKYVQSDIGNMYEKAKARLLDGKFVLFTGTPCQIDGLYSFLEHKEYENLYTLDLICHGVPSPLLWKKYLKYQEGKFGEKIEYVNFRSKEKNGWGKNLLLMTNSKSKTKLLELDKYGKHFMDGDCFRSCCYNCNYANISRKADLTLGDLWGIETINKEFYSEMGVSLVLINTKKGKELLSSVINKAEYIEVKFDDVLKYQHNLNKSTKYVKERKQFYYKINGSDFIENLKVGFNGKERIKNMLPRKFVLNLKRILK